MAKKNRNQETETEASEPSAEFSDDVKSYDKLRGDVLAEVKERFKAGEFVIAAIYNTISDVAREYGYLAGAVARRYEDEPKLPKIANNQDEVNAREAWYARQWARLGVDGQTGLMLNAQQGHRWFAAMDILGRVNLFVNWTDWQALVASVYDEIFSDEIYSSSLNWDEQLTLIAAASRFSAAGKEKPYDA